jgi:hypothetical protein
MLGAGFGERGDNGRQQRPRPSVACLRVHDQAQTTIHPSLLCLVQA